MSHNSDRVIVVGGPTASGKTDLGRAIAKRYNGVVISVDSRQVYRGLDIGTGKDTSFRQEMVDIVDPGVHYSVAKYALRAQSIISKVLSAHTIPVLVGGTGFYLDAILYNREFPSAHDVHYRARLEKNTTAHLLKQLGAIDTESANRVGVNRRRIIRALEIVHSTGKPVPNQNNTLRYDPLIIILDPGPDAVRARIATRLESRLRDGMITEVERLRKYVDHHWLHNLGLEYRYILDYCDGVYTYEEMHDLLYRAICAYARRQRTWFRRYPDAFWIQKPNEAYPLVDNFIKRYTVK